MATYRIRETVGGCESPPAVFESAAEGLAWWSERAQNHWKTEAAGEVILERREFGGFWMIVATQSPVD